MTHLILYGTTHCHLCEEAKAVVESFRPLSIKQFELSEVDIVSDDALYEQLELLIPVLENKNTGERLAWPFTGNDIIRLL